MKTISYLIENNVISAGNSNVIDMKPGEYLMDILAGITDASIDKQYTINFYNHSKTIDWTRWTELIHWPRFVHLNFVGDIDWWPVNFYPQMGFDEGLVNDNPLDKLFLGFTFERTNDDGILFKSGLPSDLKFIYFGGLDDAYSIAPDYDTLIGDIESYGGGILNLVSVEGSKGDDVRNRELYKIIDGVPVKITQSFAYCFLYGANLQLAYLYQADLQGAYLYQANLQGASLQVANLQGAYLQGASLQGAYLYQANLQNISVNNQTNFKGANLTGATNLPADMDTKAEFIAKVGAANVAANTIWIDGTSILS